MAVPKDMKKMADDDGQYRRQESTFRQKSISKEDAEKGRYILYTNYVCPWAGRTLIVRSLKKLEEYVDVTLLDRSFGEDGWYWSGEHGTDSKDPVNGFKKIKEVYHSVDPDYNLRYTIPVLYDKKEKRIVNNESADIVRLLDTFPREEDEDTKGLPELYPENLRSEIDAMEEWQYNNINNGVYKTGFATTQAAYDEHVKLLFDSLDRVEDVLSGKAKNEEPRDYLCGTGKGVFTEADVRLYMTLARFDAAYYTLFRCNLRRIKDYPNTHRYWVDMYHRPEFKLWTKFDQIKGGYAGAAKRPGDKEIIVPCGPENIL